MSRFENVSSISSFIDSMVDWLLPNTDLQDNVTVHFYKVKMCGNICPNGLHTRTNTVIIYMIHYLLKHMAKNHILCV